MQKSKKEILKQSKEKRQILERDRKILKSISKLLDIEKSVREEYADKINLVLDTIPKKYTIISNKLLEVECVSLRTYEDNIKRTANLVRLYVERDGKLFDVRMKYFKKIKNLMLK